MRLPLLFFAVLLVGCPPTGSQPCDTDADCPEGRCRFGACRPVCEADLDCGTRQICQDGRCLPPPECATSSDCARFFDCQGGTCRCQGDEACALNQSCTQGRCQTRPRCASTVDCPPPQRCEVTQGLCLSPCASSVDCAPGLDPQVALALYQCFGGTCFRRCLGDATCGTGLICRDGLCEAAECQTLSDCPSGQYCTSAAFGRCVPFTVCADDAGCPTNHTCQAFTPLTCPPGFPCAQPICQPLPLCFVDGDCQGGLPGQPATPSYCQDNHCQPSVACSAQSACAAGQACVGGICVPGGCRGHPDCPAGEACVAGACHKAPPAGDVAQLFLTPRLLHLNVGGTAQLQLVAFDLAGQSFPLPSAAFEGLDAQGNPGAAVTVDASGNVEAMAPGVARVRASVPGAAVSPVEATVHVHPQVTSGRRVVVVDAGTRAPLAGVAVLGCEDPPPSGDCPAPVQAATDASGRALFPFTAARASFSVASPELRPDGLPRYERLSLVDTTETDVLLPLSANPVDSATGFNAVISFAQVRSEGNYWLGFSAVAVGDPSDSDLSQLLGDTFMVSLPGVPQRVPVPGSLVLSTSPGLGIQNKIKDRSLAFAQPGRRAAVSFAGRTTSAQFTSARSTDLLAYTGAMDYTVQPFHSFVPHPQVPDWADVDGDGLCADPQLCPLGTEQVPDYLSFTALSFTPRHEQTRRTEVVVPDLPQGTDTAVIAVVQAERESGLLPLGFSSSAGGAPAPDGTRPVAPIVLRSGPERGGVEAGLPGVWALAVQAANAQGSQAGRVLRAATLPTRAVLPPFLPLPTGAGFDPVTRLFTPGQPAWNAAASAGGHLARVDLTGSETRHRVYFGVTGAQTQVNLPPSPAAGGLDPAGEAGARLRVTVLVAGSAPQGAGPREPAERVDAYSRWDGQ
jgi:hypothetical protein